MHRFSLEFKYTHQFVGQKSQKSKMLYAEAPDMLTAVSRAIREFIESFAPEQFDVRKGGLTIQIFYLVTPEKLRSQTRDINI